ncbi:hypothetical protein PGTUg99_035718 [Puccinia graminis f. sp. tritici]|uniref:Uncharacterized protein n=1 Tax=Puccinia graminis f. sp. tritici TaxID=56615 RepID=A0A5B0NQB4_PUCGR|nr:hypothetical protein PGTUg99_035718 [Puccinia graminis f. sp. tritici]
MQISLNHLLVVLFVIMKCNATEDSLSDYMSFFDLEIPTADYLDQLMSSSAQANVSPTNPTRRSFDKQVTPENPSNVPMVSSDVQEVSGNIPSIHRPIPVQDSGNRPNIDPKVHSSFVSSNHLFNSASLSEIRSYLSSVELCVESSADLPASGKRKRPTVTDTRNSNQEPALTKSKIISSELQDRPHHSPTKIIEDFTPFESFSNLFDSPPTRSLSSPVIVDVSSEHLRSKIRSKKEPHAWSSETQSHPFDSDIQLFSWFTFHKAKTYLAKFPQSVVNTKKRLSSQDRINWEGEFLRLNFDKTAFTNHKTYKDRFHTNIEGLIKNPLLLGHSQGKLMMTEDQYIEHHPKVNWIHATIKSDDQHKGIQAHEHNEGRARMVIGLKILLENKDAWFSHWTKHLNWRLAENPIEHIELIKPDKLSDTIVAYLFFVEMINTIVPGPQITSLGPHTITGKFNTNHLETH